MATRFVVRFVLLATFAAITAAVAQAGPHAAAELPAYTPEREAAAVEFVGQHHPDLVGVLAALKKSNSEEYEQAIREIFQTREKLAMVLVADETLYDLMLQAWVNNSHAQLLAARIACMPEPDPALEGELKRLLTRQVDLQIQVVRHNRQRTAKILEVMDSSIRALQDTREATVERRYRMLTRATKPAAASSKPSVGEPAKSKSAPATKDSN